MPRNRRSLVIGLLLLAGCQATKQPAVYVDLARATREMPQSSYPPDSAPTRSEPVPGVSITVPSLPQTSLRGAGGVGEADAKAMLDANRKKAQRQMELRLRAVYLDELSRQEEAALDEIDPSLVPAFEEARKAKELAFQEYAAVRGQAMAKLTVLVGFPDTDPKGVKPISETAHALAISRRQQADVLRAQIRKLDSDYDAEVNKLFRKIDADRDERLTEIRSKFVEARTAANARAQKEAATEMAALSERFGAVLADPRKVDLPAIPGRTMNAPPTPTASDQAMATPSGSDTALAARVNEQVDIWRAVKGYREAKSARDGRDGTDEFLRWRKSRLLGP